MVKQAAATVIKADANDARSYWLDEGRAPGGFIPAVISAQGMPHSSRSPRGRSQCAGSAEAMIAVARPTMRGRGTQPK